MKKRNKLMLTQSIKYATILILGIFGFVLWRVVWLVPDQYVLPIFYVVGGIIVISIIFDAVSVKDILPAFKS